jgi:hypothetical protein
MKPETIQRIWTVVIIVWGGLVFVFDYFQAFSGVASAVIIGFILVCPGMAFVRLLGLNSPWIEWTLAVAVSLGIDVLVAAILHAAGVWSGDLGLIVIWVLSLIGSLLPVDFRLVEADDL